ncbi:MAG: LysR family transcriptional regulator [Hyphomicrobiales bacterium]|nr:LysR family transcriptional regulator [Hyphomicrobiales bacterium]
MELRHLRYFCTVAEELNMTRAAQRLCIAQPPLTRQIKQLEEEVGVSLFRREPRGLSLTPAGKFFLDQTTQILERVTNAVEATQLVAQTGRMVFGIGFVPTLFYGQLPLLIRQLRQNDTVEIVLSELVTLQQIQALKAGRIDIGFGRIRIEDPLVEQEMLFDEPIVAALPCTHPLAKLSPSLSELAKFPLITFPATPHPNFSDIILGLFRRRGLETKVVQQTNEVQTALGLVAADMGFTLVPDVVRRVQRDGVVYVPLAEGNITSPIFCSRRKETPSDVMRQANEILRELVENRLAGRFP